MERDQDPAPAAELRKRALRLLGRREHSRRELERKLGARAAAPKQVPTNQVAASQIPSDQIAADQIQQVLDQLEQEGLLQDERFVETYVAERLNKGFGPLRVRAELLERGVGEALIDCHLQMDDEACFELLCRANRKRGGTEAAQSTSDQPNAHSAAQRRELAKRARFLEYRGFPSHLIARLLRQDDVF
jgi:regulatory protein